MSDYLNLIAPVAPALLPPSESRAGHQFVPGMDLAAADERILELGEMIHQGFPEDDFDEIAQEDHGEGFDFQAVKHLPYNQITWPGTHNSYSNDSPNSLSERKFRRLILNQHLSITEQLDAGVRVLDIELRKAVDKDDVVVCHGPALFSEVLGRSNLETLLSGIKEWVATHPDEVLTVYINPQKSLPDADWLNDCVMKYFQDSGLDELVYSYNVDRPVDEKWPTPSEMLEVGKPVMVMGLNGIQSFKMYQNYYVNDRGQRFPTWDAKQVSDLSPEALSVKLSEGVNRLFLQYCLCSERLTAPRQAWPYMFGGNPSQAAEANKLDVMGPLSQACRQEVEKEGQHVWSIWVDFVSQGSALFKVCNEMNRVTLAQAQKQSSGCALL